MAGHACWKTGVAGLADVPAIHAFDLVDAVESWMPGTRPGMTERVACASRRRSMQARRLEEAVAVGRHDGLLEGAPVAIDRERHLDAGRAARPDAPVEAGEIADLGAADREHHVAGLQARLLGGRAAREADDHDLVLDLGRVKAEPRPLRPVGPAGLQHVV